MIEVRANWQTAEVRSLLRELRPPRLHQSMSTAVNQSAKQTAKRSTSRVAKEAGLRVKDVRGSIRVWPYSKPDTLHATVKGKGKPIPLIRFNARQQKRGVSAKAWGVKKLYPGTFIATMESGHVGVFARTSKKRYPIKELWGAGVTQVMANREVMAELDEYAEDRLRANVIRQLERYAFSQRRKRR